MQKMNWGAVWTISETVMAAFSRLPFTLRGVSALILGVLLANWFWIFFAPNTTYTAVAPDRSSSLEAGRIFGITQVAETAQPDTALANVQLLGVFTASAGRPGFAVLKLDNKRQMGIAEGEEVSGGTKLATVYADHIMLERGGVKQRVNLEDKYPASANKTPAAPNKATPGKATPGKTSVTTNKAAFGAEAADVPYNVDPAKDRQIRELQKRLSPQRG